MKQKPLVCLIDEDPFVKEGWSRSLKNDATLHYFRDHLGVFKRAAMERNLIPSYSCIIMSRFYQHLNLDIINSAIPETLKSSGAGPIFLNWQGYVFKEDLMRKFDGKLFHKYGVRWQTLRLRIQKYEKKNHANKQVISDWPVKTNKVIKQDSRSLVSRPERCNAILRSMAQNASGTHREKIESYVERDQKTGIALLEAIYNRLVTDKNRPETCPSKYINSSPVIAKRILQEALFAN